MLRRHPSAGFRSCRAICLVICLLRSAFLERVGAQRALVLARAAGDGGHGLGCVGLQGLGVRVVDEGDLAGAQAVNQVLVTDRAHGRRSVPGAAALAPSGRLCVCQEGGQVRQDVVFADVGVLRPGGVRRGCAGMEVAAWLDNLQATDAKTAGLVDDAIYALSRSGPTLGRPLVDTITGSKIKNLKELRPGSSGTSEVRILLVFDPWRSAILLVAGDRSGKWNRWYAEAIPRAEQLYEVYLKERAEEESGR
jgi:hypothetical protein